MSEDKTSGPWTGRLLFGPFSLTPSERLLTRDGTPLELGGRSLDLLTALTEQPGRVLSKRDLLKQVWPDVVVEDGSLRFHMAALRKLLGDGEDGARYISTQVGVGYAFVASVHRTALDGSAEGGTVALASHGAVADALHTDGPLPPRLERMIGRDLDARVVRSRIVEPQLLTIVGAAGVGKTTLAVAIAHELSGAFDQPAAFVDLSLIQDPSLIPSAIAAALEITVQADPLTVVLGHIRSQRRLLILDNCEHLIDTVSTLAERIRAVAPKVTLLATSREPLRSRGEYLHWLGPLEYPTAAEGLTREAILAYPAVELLIERLSAADSALEIDADAIRSISDICRRLEGMPLPIELTAGHAATHGLRATAQLLGERFSLAWTGRRTALPRQQTLQATLDWSFELLPEVEQRTLERLSVFTGPFSHGAALSVACDDDIDPSTAAAALDELTAKSLVALDRRGGPNAYRLPDMTRTYARSRLLMRGDVAYRATARRHAQYFLQVLQAATPAGREELDDAAAGLAQHLGNVRAALEWCFEPEGDLSLGVPLAASSASVFVTLSLLVECQTWCARAVSHLDADAAGGHVEFELQAALGLSLMFSRGNSGAAETALRRALEVAVYLSEPWSQLRVLGRLHIFHERIGDFDTALGWATMAMQIAEAIGEPEAIAVASSLSGISHHLAGDQPLARKELELSLRQTLPSDRRRTIYYGFDHRNRSGIALARTLWLQGQADQARRIAEQTLRDAARLDHPVTHCIALIWTLSVYLWTGDLEAAEECLDTFSRQAEINAFDPYIAASGGFKGVLGVQRGQPHGALELLEESLGRLHAARYELLTTAFSIALVEGLTRTGRLAEALEVVNATIDRCRSDGELFSLPELLRLKAAVCRMLGEDDAGCEATLVLAVETSRRQGAPAWELRASLDLAQVANDPTAALENLRALRDRFTEGHDTADVQAADAFIRSAVSNQSAVSN